VNSLLINGINKNKISLSLLYTASVVNSLVLIFTDLQFGRTILLFCAIIFNSLVYKSIRSYRGVKLELIAIILVGYLSLRQILMIFTGISIYSETFSTPLFLIYTSSFLLIIPLLAVKGLTIIIRLFIYINFLFGIPDFFGVYLPFLHVDVNNILRFRGLANEPNLLAIPVLIFLYGLRNSFLRNKYYRLDLFLCIAMIILSFSKAAFFGIGFIYFSESFPKLNNLKVFAKTIITIVLSIMFFKLFGLTNYLYLLPFYNNFITLLDLELLLSFKLNDYIISLKYFDQFQSGSLGTRLATAVASFDTIIRSPLNFLFGVGGGNSYKHLIDYILINNLENYELEMHIKFNPEFVTDKTYLLKFLTEYGFFGAALLLKYFICGLRMIISKFPNNFPGMIAFFLLTMILNQSPFLFVFLYISFSVSVILVH
jgi:hypothetical protein